MRALLLCRCDSPPSDCARFSERPCCATYTDLPDVRATRWVDLTPEREAAIAQFLNVPRFENGSENIGGKERTQHGGPGGMQ